MATAAPDLPKATTVALDAELHDLLQLHRKHEVVFGASHHTFRLSDYSECSTSCEIHISNIPSGASLVQLVRLFEPQGKLLRLTLFVDDDGVSVGKATAVYENEEDAMTVEEGLNGVVLSERGPYKVVSARWGSALGKSEALRKSTEGLIVRTEMGRRLYVANIPKVKTKEDIFNHFNRFLGGLVDVMVYTYPGSTQNRGFCFIEFNSSKNAMFAKETIVASRPWGCEVVVDWADPEQEPDEEIMKSVKVLYIKNLSPRVTDADLRRAFAERGLQVERVKVIRDFAFVHFFTRSLAEKAMKVCQNLTLDDLPLQVSWAKPPINKRMREEILRRRERRMRRMLASRYNCFTANVGQGDF
ncbi:probable RNA-binding protein 46 [Galendromus occidentalis]|uniref:Probable RNA-binding protein 46 n=1 Tax=Galendromus occidentalis TaxID=34638 RepID=A0AAJ6QQ34_9ACAR|nr:probable RNA-binding protein 46 [Galendromus occidentalis]